MNRSELIQKILALAANSPLQHMFESMPWWNNWDQLSDPGLQKVLETLEEHRDRAAALVEEAIRTDPAAHDTAYAMVRHDDMTSFQKAEAQDQSAGSSDQLLSQI